MRLWQRSLWRAENRRRWRSDPVLLITGASSGIGAATAGAPPRPATGWCWARGARTGSSSSPRSSAAPSGRSRCAATSPSGTRSRPWRQATLDAFGRIDAVFANAGFGAKRGFLEESPEHWRSMVLTNVLGVALTIRATLPHLLERGTGHYVLTSSVAGRRALPGSLYSATKWAVGAIGEALRAELRQMHENSGIRVTLIEPGMTDTDVLRRAAAERARGRRHRPGGRLRALPAGARGRQRDPDPPHEPADLTPLRRPAHRSPPATRRARSRRRTLRMHFSACRRTCLALPMIRSEPVTA